MACPRRLKKKGYKWNKETNTCDYVDPNTGATRSVKGKGKDKTAKLKAKI